MSIQINYTGKLPSVVSKKLIQRVIELTLQSSGSKKRFSEASVNMISDKKMKSLNKTYRGVDKTTDVLSFSTEMTWGTKKAISNEELGDIFISIPQVKRQAKSIGRDLKTEFVLMVVHGTLHLLGYDHATDKDETKMFRMQQDVLITVGLL